MERLLASEAILVSNSTYSGGSIRIPACVNGVWGLKSTPGRFSLKGARSAVRERLTQLKGQIAIPSVIGPMGNSLASLELFCKLALAAKPWEIDPAVVELPWRPYNPPEKLVFGILAHDDVAYPQPPVRAALESTAEALRRAGHEVIPFTPPSHAQGLLVWVCCFAYTDQYYDANWW